MTQAEYLQLIIDTIANDDTQLRSVLDDLYIKAQANNTMDELVKAINQYFNQLNGIAIKMNAINN